MYQKKQLAAQLFNIGIGIVQQDYKGFTWNEEK